MRYFKGYAEVVWNYGSLSRHPIFADIRPELRHLVFRRVSISREYGFCYFRVPKAANSTISQTLQANMGPASAGSEAEFPKSALHGVPHLNDMADLFVFTVVRNPVTRLLSTYLHKVAQEKYRRKFGLYHTNEDKVFSFEDFLHRLGEDLLFRDIHWAPQTSILPYDLKKYDYVGKLENLDNDLKHITSEIFSRPSETFTIDRHRTASGEMLQQLSRRELGIIRELYERDFVELGYDA